MGGGRSSSPPNDRSLSSTSSTSSCFITIAAISVAVVAGTAGTIYFYHRWHQRTTSSLAMDAKKNKDINDDDIRVIRQNEETRGSRTIVDSIVKKENDLVGANTNQQRKQDKSKEDIKIIPRAIDYHIMSEQNDETETPGGASSSERSTSLQEHGKSNAVKVEEPVLPICEEASPLHSRIENDDAAAGCWSSHDDDIIISPVRVRVLHSGSMEVSSCSSATLQNMIQGQKIPLQHTMSKKRGVHHRPTVLLPATNTTTTLIKKKEHHSMSLLGGDDSSDSPSVVSADTWSMTEQGDEVCDDSLSSPVSPCRCKEEPKDEDFNSRIDFYPRILPVRTRTLATGYLKQIS